MDNNFSYVKRRRNLFVILIVAMFAVIGIILVKTYTFKDESFCGDGSCNFNFGETRQNCSEDCGFAETKKMINKYGFGIGYTEEGIASIFKDAGNDWAKMPLLYWGIVESNAPINNEHTYDWGKYDAIIKEYTDNGFNMQIVLKTSSTWGTKHKGKKGGNCGVPSSAPEEKHYDDYIAWIKEVVKRYSSLERPVLYYELNSEVQNPTCFIGTPEEYVEMLGATYIAIKQTNPDAKLILSGINLGDIFDDIPGSSLYDQRVKILEQRDRKKIEFIEKILAADDYYDFIEFHWNRDYKGLYGSVDFIEKYSDKPIWAGDVTSAPWVRTMHQTEFNPYFSENDGIKMYSLIQNNDENAIAWIRKKQAEYVVKKVVSSIEHGIEGVIVETVFDWGSDNYEAGNWEFQGLLDKDKTPRPAYYSYKQLISKIGNYSSVNRVNIDGDVTKNGGRGTWMFKVAVGEKNVYVMWCDDLINECPICGTKEGCSNTVNLSNYLSNRKVKITHIVTEEKMTEADAPIETVDASSVKITETPIFVEE